MNTAILLDDLSVIKDATRILSNISTAIPEGKIIGLLGPSGAGKTTIIRSILGLQKPTTGKITVFGLQPGTTALRKQTGYLSQNAASYTDLTVFENIRYFGDLLGLKQQALLQVLEQVELMDHKDQIVSSLSGGQRTRVALALALLGKPRLLLLDEPTVGLDPVLRRNLWNLFRSFADKGTTLVISSHVMDEAERCDELLFIRNGSLLISGSKQHILQSTHTKGLEEAFLALAQQTEQTPEEQKS